MLQDTEKDTSIFEINGRLWLKSDENLAQPTFRPHILPPDGTNCTTLRIAAKEG